ncbi:procathepsin L-like isoform X1 [Mobula hypostoma]|uniref:procathepsin L-like isoform X1 n=1 Tax=Mobula hypostoma TaxID=723540 RepID=UPI002FC31BBD
MKAILLSVTLLAVLLAVVAASSIDPALNEDWEKWKLLHEKQYTEEEEIVRRMVWEKNFRFIEYHNLEYMKGKHTYDLKMNHFGDLTLEEFNKLMNGFRLPKSRNSTEHLLKFRESVEIPQEIDWREKGYVTPVKNQGSCGSCWAFSAVGALEGQTFKRTKKLVSLSEQNLVDCSWEQGNAGCRGGWMENAFLYVHKNNGIDSEVGYPYTGREGTCAYEVEFKASRCSNYYFVSQGNEQALAQAVAQVGPVSVAVDATHQSFMFYHSGIYYEPNCQTYLMSHAMLVVGYGSEHGLNYWIVKNSYSTQWGNQGYILMSKDRDNNCGIVTHAVFPVILD